MLFEGNTFMPNETVEKAYDDARQWLNAQSVNQSEDNRNGIRRKKWMKPETRRIKCNIGFAWSHHKSISGAAWVLRSDDGSVLMHSRRSFTQVFSCFDAKIKSWEWALESMRSLHKSNVTFAASSMEVLKALHKPQEWPSFQGHIAPLLSLTLNQEGWDICYEENKCNRGASDIAKSVVNDLRLQSYVANGAPMWLRGFFLRRKDRYHDVDWEGYTGHVI